MKRALKLRMELKGISEFGVFTSLEQISKNQNACAVFTMRFLQPEAYHFVLLAYTDEKACIQNMFCFFKNK